MYDHKFLSINHPHEQNMFKILYSVELLFIVC